MIHACVHAVVSSILIVPESARERTNGVDDSVLSSRSQRLGAADPLATVPQVANTFNAVRAVVRRDKLCVEATVSAVLPPWAGPRGSKLLPSFFLDPSLTVRSSPCPTTCSARHRHGEKGRKTRKNRRQKAGERRRRSSQGDLSHSSHFLEPRQAPVTHRSVKPSSEFPRRPWDARSSVPLDRSPPDPFALPQLGLQELSPSEPTTVGGQSRAVG